jgi:hypothetical protein
MRDLAASRKVSSENQREILALLKGDMDISTGANHEGNMNDSEQTQWLIKNFEDDLTTQNEKNRNL